MVHRLSRSILSGIVSIVIFGSAGISLAQPYTIQSVGGFDGATPGYIHPFGIGNDGTVYGWGYRLNYPSGASGQRAMVWKDGVTYEAGPFGLASDLSTSTYTHDVNSSGVVVGNFYKYDGSGNSLGRRGGTWVNGVTSELAPLGVNTSTGSGFSEAISILDDGRIIGNSQLITNNVNYGQRATIWNGGTPTALPTIGTDPDGNGFAYVYRVNKNTGTAIGYADKYDDSHEWFGYRGVTWKNGSVVELPSLELPSDGIIGSDTNAVNNNDVVVGWCELHVNDVYKGIRPVKWENGTVTDLGTLGEDSLGRSNCNAFGVNDAGTVIGNSKKYVAGAEKGLRGVVWDPDGTMHEILPFGTYGDGSGYTNLWDLNEAGQVIGTTDKYVGGQHKGARAVFYENGVTSYIDPEFSDPTGYGFSRPQFITESGTVFGDYYKFDAAGNWLGDIAMMWTKQGGLVDLETLVIGGIESLGWKHLNYVAGRNDLGQIVGYGERLDGGTEGFVLSPSLLAPEPIIFLPALACGLMLRRRVRLT